MSPDGLMVISAAAKRARIIISSDRNRMPAPTGKSVWQRGGDGADARTAADTTASQSTEKCVREASLNLPLGSPDNMTPMAIGKSVIQTECLINRFFKSIIRSFLVRKNCHIKPMSYNPVSGSLVSWLGDNKCLHQRLTKGCLIHTHPLHSCSNFL